jgi:hypothetical protein
MADGRKNNGGHSTKGFAGRKPKDEEKRIRDLTSPYVDGAIQAVVSIMENAEKESDKLAAAKLLLAYYFGNPSQSIDHSTLGEKITNIISLGSGNKPE